jgi:hypothetical protein
MSRSKEVAWAYFQYLSEGSLDAAAALLHDDGTWWTCGSRRTIAMEKHKRLFPKALSMVPMQFTFRTAVEEGDRVVLELESHAMMPDGRSYDNVYSFVMTLRDGLIYEVREYSDSAYVALMAPTMKALYAEG